jgi:hypothetical protein
MDVTDEEDAAVLEAAMTIRGELAALAPADAEALGAALDQHIARAEAASAAERPAVVDDIFGVLSGNEPTRKRLRQLMPDTDTERGVPEGVWAPDWMTAGHAMDDEELVEITCLKCQYINRLAFRPAEDDRPDCQNPKPPPHPLEMA